MRTNARQRRIGISDAYVCMYAHRHCISQSIRVATLFHFRMLLNSSETNGATTSATSFRTGVGSGSAADDLPGSLRIAVMTSTVDVGLKLQKDAPDCRRLNVGGGALDVLDLSLATLSAKKQLNDATSIAELAGRRPCPSRVSTGKGEGRGGTILGGQPPPSNVFS